MDLFGAQAAPASAPDKTASLAFNGEPTTIEQLAEQVKSSDSICLAGVDFGQQNGLAQDLGEIIELMGKSGVDERFINLNMEYLPKERSPDLDLILIAPDGSLSMAGSSVDISELPGLLSKDRKVGIESDSRHPPPPFSAVLSVVQAVGPEQIHHLFIVNRVQQIRISAEIYRLTADGVRDVLSAPRMTTMPGSFAKVRVVENATGWQNYKPEQDGFHQEDLANLGIRLSAQAQILGGYIRVIGTAVLIRSTSRQEVFQQDGIPVYSYSVTKTVAPFSVVLPVLNDGAEFPVANVDGVETRCRLSVELVDDMGMTPANRERARSMGSNSM